MATYEFTTSGNGSDSWEVPEDVNEVSITCYGGRAGSGRGDGVGGDGGVSTGDLSVSPGQTLYLKSFAGGSAGFRAGDGGEGAAVRYPNDNQSSLVIAAGGGGGAGGGGFTQYDGGDGGGMEGEDDFVDTGGTSGGYGGTQSSGGTANGGQSGQRIWGGDGADDNDGHGGGGGSGYYGGGGGGSITAAGYGGGGASGYIGGVSSANTSVGASNESSARIVIEYPEPPQPPTNTQIDDIGLETANLSWDAPTSGGDVDEYRIERSVDGGPWSFVTEVSGTSYTDSGLSQRTDYRYRVRSENTDGTSDFDYTETRETGGTPASFTVSVSSGSALELSWSNPPGDLSAVEIYRAESLSGSIGDYTLVTTDSSGSYTNTGLVNGRTYHYRLIAVYFDADSSPTPDEQATTDLPVPTLLGVTAGSRETDTSWAVEDNNPDGDITIERSDDGGGSWSEAAVFADLSVTNYNDGGLLDGAEYAYRLVRDTGDASVQTGPGSDTTLLPAPTDLSSDSVGDDVVDISWNATHNNGDTRVERREDDSGSWTIEDTVSRSTEQATVSGLLNGQLYGIRVVAETDDAETEDE